MKSIKRQIRIINQKEAKFLSNNEHQFLKNKIDPFVNKLEDKIPDKLIDGLNTAFFKGFKLVFDKGTKYIEKTYNKSKIELQHNLNSYDIEKTLCRKSFNKIDRQVFASNIKNASISIVEGSALGVFGIGLPDVPLFIAVMMKTIYEIALHYGYDYESKKERYFILLLICVAMTKGTEQKVYHDQMLLFERNLKQGIEFEIELEEQMKITAKVLANTLVIAKFVQGITFLGIIGGAINYTIIRKISEYACLKYKKRYLYDLLYRKGKD